MRFVESVPAMGVPERTSVGDLSEAVALSMAMPIENSGEETTVAPSNPSVARSVRPASEQDAVGVPEIEPSAFSVSPEQTLPAEIGEPPCSSAKDALPLSPESAGAGPEKVTPATQD